MSNTNIFLQKSSCSCVDHTALFSLQQEDRKQLLRAQANQLLEEAKFQGAATNIDQSNLSDSQSSHCEEEPPPAMSVPSEFNRNPFTLVMKKSLKQLTSNQYLKAEKKEKSKGNDPILEGTRNL